MAKEQFQRTKPHVNVGTIGHARCSTRRCIVRKITPQLFERLGEFKNAVENYKKVPRNSKLYIEALKGSLFCLKKLLSQESFSSHLPKAYQLHNSAHR